jgi:RimJ/RimL family protein N-acetyltransferase
MVSTACARAFAAFDLHTLNAYHYVENHRSAALLRRVGFHIRAAMDSVPPDLAAFLRPQVHLTLDRPD